MHHGERKLSFGKVFCEALVGCICGVDRKVHEVISDLKVYADEIDERDVVSAR